MARLQARGYRSWTHIAANGKERRIEDAVPPLKKVHARIADLLSRTIAPNYLMCPVKGKSYITNASLHKDAQVIHSLDIQAYFPSTTDRRVYWFFHKVMKCSSDVAALLTNLCTVEGHLPTGSPVSPYLSYFAHLDLWNEVSSVCQKHDCGFSLYVDDLTISGRSVPGALVWEVKKLIHSVGLRSNARKERRSDNGRAEITGVIIDNGKFRVPKRGYKKLHERRAQLSAAVEPEERLRLRNAIRSIEAQHNQVRRGS